MDKVVVTRAVVNICTMQVCAESDATDEEILAICNRDNISGTTNGWSRVIRTINESPDAIFDGPNKGPVQCRDNQERTHFLVLC